RRWRSPTIWKRLGTKRPPRPAGRERRSDASSTGSTRPSRWAGPPRVRRPAATGDERTRRAATSAARRRPRRARAVGAASGVVSRPGSSGGAGALLERLPRVRGRAFGERGGAWGRWRFALGHREPGGAPRGREGARRMGRGRSGAGLLIRVRG